jgi:pimeloyl-ACP methyl ester carboxylesterase
VTNPPLAPVVLLPGLLCDATLWRAQVEGLADIAAALIPDLTLDETVRDMAARTLAVAPPRFALAALSMGGYVAFDILRQAPGRVTRLALFATSAAPDSPERATERKRGMESLKLGRFMGVTQRMLPQLVHPSHVSDAVGETVKAMAERVGGAAFLRQQHAILSRPDSRPTLSIIKIPTLVAVGDGDVLTPPSESREIHRGIAGSRLHIFETCGHLPALEQPDETTAVLRDWLGYPGPHDREG